MARRSVRGTIWFLSIYTRPGSHLPDKYAVPRRRVMHGDKFFTTYNRGLEGGEREKGGDVPLKGRFLFGRLRGDFV